MSSKIGKKTFKEIPANATVIQIIDDDENNDGNKNDSIDLWCDEIIDAAILTKSLDEMKKAIFLCLIRRKEKCSLQKAVQLLKQKYTEYFKENLNMNIESECYKAKHEIENKSADLDKHHIIVHGVDFLANCQLESKFKGLHPVQVERINMSNASIRFNSEQNVDNLLTLQMYNKKSIDLEQIEEEDPFSWRLLKKYNVLVYERALKFRFASVDEKTFQKEDSNLNKFETAKAQIHKSILFIDSDDDKSYFDSKMRVFEQNLMSRPWRHSRGGRSEISQSSHRERTRDNRQGGRYQNRNGNESIDNLNLRLGQRDRRRNRNESFTQRNQGYRTERHNDRRNQNYTDRRKFERDDNRGREGRRNGYDRQSQTHRSNFRDNRNNPNNENNDRSNRFFRNQNNNQQRQNDNSSKSISLEHPAKSASKSRSDSSKSYGINEDIRQNNEQNNDKSMSFAFPNHNNTTINAQQNQQNSQLLIAQIENNASMFMNQHQQQSLSFIIPETGNTIDKEEEEDSVGDILQRMEAQNNDFGKENKDKSNRSRKNSSINSKSNSWDSKKYTKQTKQTKQKKQKKHSPKSNHNSNQHQSTRGGNRSPSNRDHRQNNRDCNFNRGNNNRDNYNGRNKYDNNYNNGNRYDNHYQRQNNNQYKQNQRNNRQDQRNNRQDHARDYNSRNTERQGRQNGNYKYGSNRQSNNNNQFNNNDRRFNNNNNRQYNNDRPYNNDRQSNQQRENQNVFDRYKKNDKPKPIHNLDEEEIEY